MAWIEVHQALVGHRKIKKLKRALKIKEPQAIGHMTMLWLWCIDNAPDGDLDALEPEDIAEAVEWTGDPQKFLDALIDAGFVDQGESLLVHDWAEYTGASLEKRNERKEQNKTRQQRYRDRNKSVTPALRNAETSVTEDERNANVTRYGSVTEPLRNENLSVTPALRNAPNLTLPNLTLPNHTTTGGKRNDIGATVTRYANSEKPPASPAADAYVAKINPTPSSGSMQELLAFERELGSDVCLRAIDTALDNNARSWNYVKAVLQRCKDAGIKSLEDWDRNEAARMDRKAKRRKDAGGEPDYGPPDTSDLDRMWEEMQKAGEAGG